MDSSSMAPANNSGRMDASAAADDDGLVSVTQTLAKEACVLFQLGKYGDSLKVLHQLLQKKADDPKILHNVAVAENFQDGFSNSKKFLEELNNLKRRCERLTHSSGENTEAMNNGSTSVGNKGTNTSQSIPVDDDFDVSVIMFNIAVTLYHLHEYERSFSILEGLYQNIQPIDERVARHICLLLLDVSLVCHRASRAADVIHYLERVGGNILGSQGGDTGNVNQQQSTNLVTKSTSAPGNVNVSDLANPDSTVNPNCPDSPLSRTLSEETLYESLMSTLDISGSHNPKKPSNDLPKTHNESLVTPHDLRLKVHLYKVWVLLVTRNLKAAKREVKLAMNVAHGKDYSLALFLKSQLEYARGNYRKSIKLLMVSNNTETGTLTLYYNNLGCVYYQLGKYQTSALLFSKAIGNSSGLRKEKPLKLLSFSQDKSTLFVYNCGLVYLASGKPLLAVRCFQKAGLAFFKRPLLWLRMAECCIMDTETKPDIKVNVVGRGKWRQLVVESRNSRNGVRAEEPNLSLTFAKRCLLNALYLMDDNSNPKGLLNPEGEAKESKAAGNNGVYASLQSSINDYEGLCGKENRLILQAILSDLAFVYLELGNPVKALAAARCLLRLPECSRVYVFLGNLYAAEALCLLNRPKQASEHLSTYVSEQTHHAESPYSQEDFDTWHTRKTVDFEEPKPNVDNTLSPEKRNPLFLKPEEARGVLLANIAALAAVEGDMERAHEAATLALSAIPNRPEVVLTATYVDLVRGNTRDAIAKLKQCSQVRFTLAENQSLQLS